LVIAFERRRYKMTIARETSDAIKAVSETIDSIQTISRGYKQWKRLSKNKTSCLRRIPVYAAMGV
jgi:hypothetical protein